MVGDVVDRPPSTWSGRRRAVVGAGIAMVLATGMGMWTVNQSCEASPAGSLSSRCPVSLPGGRGASTGSPTSPPPTVGLPVRSGVGVPEGVVLTDSGPLTIDVAGTVIDSANVLGTVSILADDVTVRRSRVTASAWSVIKVGAGVRGVRIEDVEVNGMGLKGQGGSAGIDGTATITRALIEGVENGVEPGDGSVIEGSIIRRLAAPGPDPHIDGIEIDGGSDILIRGNLVDLTEWDQTSTVMVDNYFAPVKRIRVEGNRLLGGGYTVYSDGRFKGGSMVDISFVANRMVKGRWGYAAIAESDPVWVGNVDDLSGASIDRP